MEDKKYNPGDEEDPASFALDDVFDKKYFVSKGDVYMSEEEKIKYVDKEVYKLIHKQQVIHPI